MSSIKEPHFFAFEERFRKGIKEHDNLFEHAIPENSIFGESSTNYCVLESAIHRIYTCNPNIKIVVLVRHPVDRLLSHYRWMYAQGKETLELRKAVEFEIASGYDLNVHRGGCYPWYRRHSAYAEYCELMKRTFSESNVLFIKTESLENNLKTTLDSVFRFLKIQTLDKLNFEFEEVRVNQTAETKTPRTLWLRRYLERFKFIEQIAKRVPGKRIASQLLGDCRIEPPVISDESILYIENLLKNDIEYFEAIETAV